MDGLIDMQAAQKPQRPGAPNTRRKAESESGIQLSAFIIHLSKWYEAFFSSLLALQKRHAQAHQIVEGIPMHHVLAAIDDVEIDLWLHFF
jgi:hypothetical protein